MSPGQAPYGANSACVRWLWKKEVDLFKVITVHEVDAERERASSHCPLKPSQGDWEEQGFFDGTPPNLLGSIPKGVEWRSMARRSKPSSSLSLAASSIMASVFHSGLPHSGAFYVFLSINNLGRLVHTSLGSSFLIAHVLHCPPPPAHTAS